MTNKAFIICILIAFSTFATAQRKKIDAGENQDKATSLSDSTQTPKTKDFSKITAGAKLSQGLFNIYKTKSGNYYFEIADSLLGRDMLIAARVVNISDNNKISAGQMRSNPILISFSRR